MTDATAIGIARQAIWIALLLSGPLVGLGLVVGLLVSVLQATTQINEQTLTFVPKLLAVGVAAVLFGPWMLRMLLDFAQNMFALIPGMVR